MTTIGVEMDSDSLSIYLTPEQLRDMADRLEKDGEVIEFADDFVIGTKISFEIYLPEAGESA